MGNDQPPAHHELFGKGKIRAYAFIGLTNKAPDLVPDIGFATKW